MNFWKWKWEWAKPDLPSIAKRNHVINVHVRSRRPGRPVVRAHPGARGSGTGGVLNDVCAVALEDYLAGVAVAIISLVSPVLIDYIAQDSSYNIPALRNPVRKQISRVAILASLSCHRQASEQALCRRGSRDIGGSTRNEVERRRKGCCKARCGGEDGN